MKMNHRTIFLSVLILLAFMVGVACNLPGILTGESSTPPTAIVEVETSVVVETETPEIIETVEAAADTPEPTSVPPNHGQIAFVNGGNVWLFQVDSGVSTQVTTDGIPDSYENSYESPQISADGQTLAYKKNNISYLHNLTDNTVTSLIHQGRFFHWAATPNLFYVTLGGMECPSLENLDDQVHIRFDVLRLDRNALDAEAVYLGSVVGGLRFAGTISNDEQWASFLNCGCYSECGAYSVMNLATSVEYSIPAEVMTGEIDFSPNSQRLAVAAQQVYGYVESPLYVANPDFSGLVPIYTEAGVAAYVPMWSPDGEWIAFTALILGADDMTLAGSRVMVVAPDGHGLLTVESDNAELLAWSPDGSQLLYSQKTASGTSIMVYDLVSGAKNPLPISLSGNVDWGVLP